MTAAALNARALRAWRRHVGHPIDDPVAYRADLAAGTLPGAFAATASTAGDRPALTIDGTTLTHGELDARSAALARGLAELGAAPGTHVLLSGSTTPGFVVAYLAALRAGATVVLAGAQMTGPELEHLVSDSDPRLAVAEPSTLARLAGIADRRGLPVVLISLSGSIPVAAMPIADLQAGPGLTPVAVDSASPALLAYTSGTTGRPKGVVLTHGNLLASIRAAMLAWRWSPDDVLVHALPLSHQHGLGGLHASLLAGSRLVALPRFDPGGFLDALADCAATVTFAVPAILQRLVEAGSARTLPRLRLAVSGSAPLSPTLAGRVRDLLGVWPLERYGTTESGLDVSNLHDGPRVPGSVGLPLPGVEVEILTDGELAPPGATGEIVVRGPQVFAGYHRRPDATAESFLPDGWFRTGDIGRLDPETEFLRITGRRKELIISGGLNVYPREVELVLEEHPAVAEACVVGLPSARWGEEVVAAIVPAPAPGPAAPAALDDHVRERLSPHKRPKRYVQVEALPRNAMGKVLRAELAAQLAGPEGMLP